MQYRNNVTDANARFSAARPIVIEDYNPGWPGCFRAESSRLKLALAEQNPVIRHIGSTAVTGLPAKPIIDIMVGFASTDDLTHGVSAMQDAGYCYHPEFESVIPERRFFTLFRDGEEYNIHAVPAFGEFWFERLRFCDCLRTRPEIAFAYSHLKYALAKVFGSDRRGYSEAKTSFISATARGEGPGKDRK